MKAPFPIDPVLVAIMVAYKNTKLIADDVLFRVPVGKQEFKYWNIPKGQNFTIPDTKVGRASKPNQVTFNATEETDSTVDYALDDPIPNADIENAPSNFNPVNMAVQGIANLIALDREVRTANLVFNAANYATANKIQLSGNAQFSDFTNSDPIGVIMAGLDACVMRPNEMTIGRLVFSKLSQHPDINKATKGNSGDTGIARRQQIAELFELDAVHVGEAFVNTAKPGQTVSLNRAWGKHISLQYVDRTANTRGGTTFGYTAQFGDPIAGKWENKNIGMRGGQMTRAGESVKELIVANDLGYFIEDAIA